MKKQSFFQKLKRWLSHSLWSVRDAKRVLPPAAAERLKQSVAQSELKHSGEIRICVEAALPTSYLWRGLQARDRAVMLFGKLRVWDTAHNNGVLIYLLLAERKVEIVADRGLNEKVTSQQWHDLIKHMGAEFKTGKYEVGLEHAVLAVTGLLIQHFPLSDGEKHHNELPNQPIVQ